MDESLIEKPHFGLRRVHVHVHAVGRELDEEMDLGTSLLDRRDAVRLLNRVGNRAVAHHPAIDEDVLRSARRALIGKRRDEPLHADARRVLGDRDEIGTVAVDLKEALDEPTAPAALRAGRDRRS